jgi:hypothetical protein
VVIIFASREEIAVYVSFFKAIEVGREKTKSFHESIEVKATLYKHWEYHWFCAWQVDPDWQQVGPLHPCPPHCPHLAEHCKEMISIEDILGEEKDENSQCHLWDCHHCWW